MSTQAVNNITETSGDIFNSSAQTLVCPVNTVGTMGKGLAKAFAQKYPGLLDKYKKLCANKALHTYRPSVVEFRKKKILLFATKEHWKNKSRLEWIKQGLRYLSNNYFWLGISSIAFPAIGCGLGGLEWSEVKPLIYKYLANKERLEVIIYNPSSSDIPRPSTSSKSKSSTSSTSVSRPLSSINNNYNNGVKKFKKVEEKNKVVKNKMSSIKYKKLTKSEEQQALEKLNGLLTSLTDWEKKETQIPNIYLVKSNNNNLLISFKAPEQRRDLYIPSAKRMSEVLQAFGSASKADNGELIFTTNQAMLLYRIAVLLDKLNGKVEQEEQEEKDQDVFIL